MVKTFYLVRHGTKENLAGDPPLSNLGIKQAEITADYLSNLGIKKIYSSPLKRTFQTAQIIASKLGIEVTVDKRLTERINWDGTYPLEQFLKEWRKTDLEKNYQPSHGFSSAKSGERMNELLDFVSINSQEDRVLFTAHGGIITDVLLTLFSENELVSYDKDFTLTRSTGLIKECSITILKVEEGKYRLEQLGSTRHLIMPLD